jgi:drug/metabolite transporter (DMT)-like permease
LEFLFGNPEHHVIGRQIFEALRSLGPALGSAFEALLLIAGATLIAYGAWLAYPPAGAIVGGVLVIVGVILRQRGSAEDRR